jgi:hypothetical protein
MFGNDGARAGFGRLKCVFADIETEAAFAFGFVRSVAKEAILAEDGTDFALEIDWAFGAKGRGGKCRQQTGDESDSGAAEHG